MHPEDLAARFAVFFNLHTEHLASSLFHDPNKLEGGGGLPLSGTTRVPTNRCGSEKIPSTVTILGVFAWLWLMAGADLL